MTSATLPPSMLAVAAERLADLLTGGGSAMSDPTGSELIFEPGIVPRPLARSAPPEEVWAVDGGQALVADARCLQLVVTRAARVRFCAGECTEYEGELQARLVGCGEERAVAAGLGLGIAASAAIDLNLLRDREEWVAVEECVADAQAGALVLIDGDLVPDWRIPSYWLKGLFERAATAGVILAGITTRSSLARGGAPLIGQLELEAQVDLGPRSLWWTPVARTRADVDAGIQVIAARLDPDARFAFRIDLPGDVEAEPVLSGLAGLCDDAAFPGYPYPLTVADRLAACPRWLRDEAWLEVEGHFDRVGVPYDVRERAFADRHGLMERF
ncbi:MAG TPA: DNA double-strand break repair nuclease NurA [Acidimicrobiales bacterium]|nr:DNA double-strand break repair nuclease NurA [Acidimicrobiales bacterium]